MTIKEVWYKNPRSTVRDFQVEKGKKKFRERLEEEKDAKKQIEDFLEQDDLVKENEDIKYRG